MHYGSLNILWVTHKKIYIYIYITRNTVHKVEFNEKHVQRCHEVQLTLLLKNEKNAKIEKYITYKGGLGKSIKLTTNFTAKCLRNIVVVNISTLQIIP